MSQFDLGMLIGMYVAIAGSAASVVRRKFSEGGSSDGVSLLMGLLSGALWPVVYVIGLFIKDEKKPKKN